MDVSFIFDFYEQMSGYYPADVSKFVALMKKFLEHELLLEDLFEEFKSISTRFSKNMKDLIEIMSGSPNLEVLLKKIEEEPKSIPNSPAKKIIAQKLSAPRRVNLHKGPSAPKKSRGAIERQTWSPLEKRKLQRVVERQLRKVEKNTLPRLDWNEISSIVDTKSAAQCFQHWFRVLKPALYSKEWSHSEELDLARAIRSMSDKPFGVENPRWCDLAKTVERSDIQVRYRYQKFLKLYQSWSFLQIKKLRSVVKTFAIEEPGWAHIADEIKTKVFTPTGEQCRLVYELSC